MSQWKGPWSCSLHALLCFSNGFLSVMMFQSFHNLIKKKYMNVCHELFISPQCGMGDRCAMKFGPRIGKLCDCGRGANCNSYLLKCIWGAFFPFSQSQLHFCRTADILHEGSAASTDCHRPTPRLRFHYLYLLCIVAWGWAWVFLYFWQSTVVACECFMFNKHIYQLRSILVFSQCSLFIYRIFFIHVTDIYTQFQGWYKNSAAVHSHE